MANVTVATARSKGNERILSVRSEAGQMSYLALPRFSLVGPGDELRIRNGSAVRIVEVAAADGETWIPIGPGYRREEPIRIGTERYRIAFNEPESEQDFQGYQRLESFHYKGRVLDNDPNEELPAWKGLGGRRSVLVATVSAGNRARMVGYIELQMPLMMCKPRHDLFSSPFRHRPTDTKWKSWLGDGQKHVNRIVRIARVVVDPEFRGLGLSRLLVQHAKTFAAERWTIGGKRPLFIEISAEMLRYMDFVSNAGLVYVGDTEGNLERIAKDLHSIELGASGKSGIMSLQRKYHAAFKAYCQKTNKSFDEARTILQEVLTSNNPREAMASDEWLAFRPMLRFPIPYYIAGLDADAHEYVEKCAESLRARTASTAAVQAPVERTSRSRSRKGVALQHNGLEVWIDHQLDLTAYVRLAMDSFGIDTARVRTKLLGPVNVDLVPGNVALITGASGAGKSVLLDALSGHAAPQGLMYRGDRLTGRGVVARLEELPRAVPLLQFFGHRYGPERAFDALCRVGLSEAMVFVKPFELLSMGQRYRAMLADLLLRNADVWLIDEFCSNVDPVTAAVIASQIKRLARKLGVIVVAAAANTMHFVDALLPDVLYVVRTGGDVLKMGMKEFKNGFYEKGL